MHSITYGEALQMAPAPYTGKCWLTVSDIMAIEGLGEAKCYEMLEAERVAEHRRYYVDRCGRTWRINAAQYWWYYYVGCLYTSSDGAVA